MFAKRETIGRFMLFLNSQNSSDRLRNNTLNNILDLEYMWPETQPLLSVSFKVPALDI